MREQLIVAVRDHPAALGLFLVPDDWPEAQRTAIKELRRRHDRLFRDVVEEGVAAGEFVVVDVDTTLHCLHAAMTQASVWYSGLREAALDARGGPPGGHPDDAGREGACPALTARCGCAGWWLDAEPRADDPGSHRLDEPGRRARRQEGALRRRSSLTTAAAGVLDEIVADAPLMSLHRGADAVRVRPPRASEARCAFPA